LDDGFFFSFLRCAFQSPIPRIDGNGGYKIEIETEMKIEVYDEEEET
jgi:hypothetical protein